MVAAEEENRKNIDISFNLDHSKLVWVLLSFGYVMRIPLFQPEAVPARVTLGVTSLLTLSTQHANSQKSLPPVSYIKVNNIPI